ncbi:MAG: hypothetical protein ACFBZ8_07120 [Opitutales bacterium]
MKSAYELAMERLQATEETPARALTDAQREQLAELDRKFQAKIAEREIALNPRIETVARAGNPAEAEKLREELAGDRQRLQAECEAAKEQVRQSKG